MKQQACQAKTEAKTWADAISFAQSKILELKKAIKIFENSRRRGDAWPGSWPETDKAPEQVSDQSHPSNTLLKTVPRLRFA